MSINPILSKLDKVRKNGYNRWIACCPAHDDRNPSLSIAEPEPNKILIHCHAGCKTSNVLAAIDLEMTDLFPDNANELHFKPLYWASKEKNQQDQLAKDLALKKATLSIYEQDLKKGVKYSSADNKKYKDIFIEVRNLDNHMGVK